ncbi:hypothetical protein [Phenylobacterium sp.]|uniref:hypothetical protein n=1 Tax=Phenylobacterium sp. TaxID=1871053 RepID=UPI0019940B94|nr:hypothetical protein [Phenylobacterium sp.]MBC7166201.1 hypothetical protein [Phenylobacterium sp.]
MAIRPEQTEVEAQDQAETLDEDNVIGAGDDVPPAEMRTFENIRDVRDETSAQGDADDDAGLIAEQLDDEEIVALEREGLDGFSVTGDDDPPVRAAERGAPVAEDEDEVSLLDAGDMDQAPGTDRADIARYESNRVSDEDLDDLGYGEGEEKA